MNEPVMVWGTLGTLIGAALMAAMQQFMPDMGNEMMTSIVELVVFLVPILGGLWYARGQVDGPITSQDKANMIQVGDITDSKNIVVGKDIKQKIEQKGEK